MILGVFPASEALDEYRPFSSAVMESVERVLGCLSAHKQGIT